jgi:hypothetical protein
VQRQQVRAAVWPILEFENSNTPDIHRILSNKRVGSAIVKNVIVTLDGQPAADWSEVLEKILGPGNHHLSESDMGGHVLSPGESLTIFSPHDDNMHPLTMDTSNPVWLKLNEGRQRIGVEICYSSTLGESWTLRAGGKTRGTTTATGSCPGPSATTFQQ